MPKDEAMNLENISDETSVYHYPGLEPLSDQECRMMRVRLIGRDVSGAFVYVSVQENGPVSTATDPSQAQSSQPMSSSMRQE